VHVLVFYRLFCERNFTNLCTFIARWVSGSGVPVSSFPQVDHMLGQINPIHNHTYFTEDTFNIIPQSTNVTVTTDLRYV